MGCSQLFWCCSLCLRVHFLCSKPSPCSSMAYHSSQHQLQCFFRVYIWKWFGEQKTFGRSSKTANDLLKRVSSSRRPHSFCNGDNSSGVLSIILLPSFLDRRELNRRIPQIKQKYREVMCIDSNRCDHYITILNFAVFTFLARQLLHF